MASGVSIRYFSKFLSRYTSTNIKGVRTFLSEAYRCQDAWDRRLESPLIKKIKLDDMYYEIDQKFNQEGIISAVDVDLFATAVNGDVNIEELEDLIHRLRMSCNASKILPSTPHSLIRAFWATKQYDSLLRVLNDRLNYGVFPNHYTANLLMDSFIKNKQYLEAAKIGVLQMLQEDWDHPVTTSLSLLSCIQHLLDPKPWDSVGQSPAPPPDEDKEERKVRVDYVRNPHFDDHFDLEDGHLLVGKTLALLGPHLLNSQLASSLELLGWIMYGKWNKALEKIQQQKSSEPFIKQAVDMSVEVLKSLEADDSSKSNREEIVSLLSSVPTTEASLVTLLEGIVKDAVSQHEADDIKNQTNAYNEWENLREQELVEQLRQIDIERRLKIIEEKKQYLQEKEERLYFFDKEHEWDLKIEENKPNYQETWTGKRKKKRVIDEDYVPPEITKNVNK